MSRLVAIFRRTTLSADPQRSTGPHHSVLKVHSLQLPIINHLPLRPKFLLELPLHTNKRLEEKPVMMTLQATGYSNQTWLLQARSQHFNISCFRQFLPHPSLKLSAHSRISLSNQGYRLLRKLNDWEKLSPNTSSGCKLEFPFVLPSKLVQGNFHW